LPTPVLAMTDRPTRLAFVGQSTYFEACVLDTGTLARIDTRFHEYRGGADVGPTLESLAAFDPDVVIVFRPEIIPTGAFGGLRATTVGFLTEPLPRTARGAGASHEDLERRLWELGEVDGSNFDRIVAFDPLITATADRVLPVWRSIPLPVSDRYYRPVTAPDPTAPPLFVGRSTEHREAILTEAKHRFDVLHLAFGVGADRLERVMGEHWMAINIHNEPYPSFENRVCLHLAAGHLVASEPLSPSHGLESGIDYLEFQSGEHLARMLGTLRRDATVWHAVRVRGRRKAEQFRASRVYPRLVTDLLADVRAFGSPRTAAA
jgi:hypothetical protein